MDDVERVRLASAWARHVSPFWGQPPVMFGVISAWITGIVGYFFIGVAQLEFGDHALSWFLTIVVVFFLVWGLARFSNNHAAKAFRAELDRLR